jgi:hypothetical protein
MNQTEKKLLYQINTLLLGGVLVFYVLANQYSLTVEGLSDFFPLCLFKYVTHLPCATCGLTRSFLSLAHGHWQEAFFYNPLGFLLYFGAIVFFLMSLLLPSQALLILRMLRNPYSLYTLFVLLGLTWLFKLLNAPVYW